LAAGADTVWVLKNSNTDSQVFRGTLPGASGRNSRVLVIALDGEARQRWEQLVEPLSGGALSGGAGASSSDLADLARQGGSCVALAAFGASSRDSKIGEPAFAISVGDAVLRGLPTAARATITGRVPLRGGVVEAPFGGGFARSLVRTTDVLLVFGAARPRRALIEIDADGRVAIREATIAVGASTRERARALTAGGAHALLVGPAAEAGLPFANLGSWDAPGGSVAPSLVGRGGMGRTVAQAGVVGISVAIGDAALDDAATAESKSELHGVLESSPRLVARALGGTLELGDVRGEATASTPSARPKTRHGCVGCPTPCGWQFEVPSKAAGDTGGSKTAGARVGGRFAALQGFLGGGDVEAAMATLEQCNELGMDARSAAMLIHESGEAHDVSALMDPQSPLHRRALAMVPADDIEPARPLLPSDLAGSVGVRLGARGPEPLRSLSVLGLSAGDAADSTVRDRWRRELHLDGLGVSAERNAGVIAHWQECFSAALDHSGFCAFSGSALVADGICTVGELAEAVTESLDGVRWLALGAAICEVHRELRGVSLEAEALLAVKELPEEAVSGFVEAVRGSDRRVAGEKSAQPAASGAGSRAGVVHVHATGLLASKLRRFPGATEAVEPATGRTLLQIELEVGEGGESVRCLLERMAGVLPGAERWLLQPSGDPLPAVLIAGRGVAGGRLISAGDAVELLLVIPGG
jgi:hypothetical protein